MRKILLVVLLALVATSCVELISEAGKAASEQINNQPVSTSAHNYEKVSLDSVFHVDLPIYMKPMNQLNSDAVLQYGNIYKETYFVVIQEDKNEYVELFKEFGDYNDELPVIENYKNAQKNMFTESLTNPIFQDYGLSSINDKPARQIKIFGKVDDIEVVYIIAFVEGEKDIFMLMNWTVNDKLDKYENSFEYINGTFKLINK
ncbi:hypothetical protein [Winogradskyella sp. SYSU M77433]|uniref:hypothetical protein n=1 Tax=Winogradskyella sp. SYSU M77433 TaxID=3042722 RepID=UPI002480E8DB|nr:hypothetical protein [Winogradskyella sp. SYSU M77433]MDH7913937.1 hypothetical protein [Winogradskyella sp. SYSU M77433]